MGITIVSFVVPLTKTNNNKYIVFRFALVFCTNSISVNFLLPIFSRLLDWINNQNPFLFNFFMFHTAVTPCSLFYHTSAIRFKGYKYKLYSFLLAISTHIGFWMHLNFELQCKLKVIRQQTSNKKKKKL